jgi:hypothetical protein
MKQLAIIIFDIKEAYLPPAVHKVNGSNANKVTNLYPWPVTREHIFPQKV